MGFSIFENEISGHSHLIKVENHEKLIENIEMQTIFHAFLASDDRTLPFLLNYEKLWEK